MHMNRFKLFLLLVLLITQPLLGRVLQYENRTISKIELSLAKPQPDNTFNPRAILTRLKSQENSPFSEADFDSDLKMLAGEFDKVDPKVNVVDGEIQVSLKVWPKPTIRRIIWEGNERIKTSKLQDELGIALQSTFDRKRFNDAFRELQKYYVKKGYFESNLRYETDPDDATNEVEIFITVDEGRSGRVGTIKVDGVTEKEEAEIVKILYSKEYALPWSWFSDDGTYREDFIQQDKLVVQDYLRNQGFAEAAVDVKVDEMPTKDRITVTFVVTKGPVYRAGKFTFSGNTLFDFDTIDKQFALREGEPFSPEKVRETVHNIQTLYGKQGYIDCIVPYEPHVNPDDLTYSVHFTITEGEQYRVGMIKVFGNSWTNTEVILHETLVIPGEVFDLEKLRYTEQRLMNVGYFENVNVYAVGSEELSQLGDNFRDVHIEVEEKGTGSFGLSGGFSSRSHAFLGFHMTERNFDIAGLPRIFSDGLMAVRGGGEYAHLEINVGQKETAFVASWTKPYFCDSIWSLGVDAEKVNSRVNSDDYTLKRVGFGVHANRPINAFVRFGVGYTLSDNDMDTSAKASAAIKAKAKNNGVISAVNLSLTYDSRNHPTEPTSGFFSRLLGSCAGLGGDFNFWTVNYLNSFYSPVTEDGVLKMRADIRQIVPFSTTTAGKLPTGSLYFLGGDDTIRGYRYGAIGDKFMSSVNDPTGGVTSLLFSTEYMHRITNKLSAFVFVDGGSISQKTFNSDCFHASVGYGARLKLVEALPPIIVGMGYPLNPAHRSDVMKFVLTIGGSF